MWHGNTPNPYIAMVANSGILNKCPTTLARANVKQNKILDFLLLQNAHAPLAYRFIPLHFRQGAPLFANFFFEFERTLYKRH